MIAILFMSILCWCSCYYKTFCNRYKMSSALGDLLAMNKKLAGILRHPLDGYMPFTLFFWNNDFWDIVIWHCQISKNTQCRLLDPQVGTYPLAGTPRWCNPVGTPSRCIPAGNIPAKATKNLKSFLGTRYLIENRNGKREGKGISNQHQQLFPKQQ